jgi:long-chain fatty acid transport protein
LKKKLIAIAAALLLSTGTLFAGNLDYLGNQSAIYLQTLNRNAATDGADIINYNPAGTAFLPDGLHLDLSNQFLFKLYEHTVTARLNGPLSALLGARIEDIFKPEAFTPLLPNFYLSYNFGNLGLGRLALNLQAGVVAGGGELDYGNGTGGSTFAIHGLRAALTAQGVPVGQINSQSFTASSIYYNVALGGAYSFLNDMFSLSAGARLVIPRRGFTLEAEFINGTIGKAEVEYNALGVTPIIGFDVRPIEKLTIGLRYEFETRLEFEYDVTTSAGGTYGIPVIAALPQVLRGAGIVDGKKFNMNLPQILAAGVEYEVIPGLALDLSGTLYFLPQADLYFVSNGIEKGAGDYFDMGYDIGIGAKWQVLKALRIGAGFSYTEVGAKQSYYDEQAMNATANPPLDSVNFGLGVTYSFGFGLDINLGVLYAHYLPADYKASASSGMVTAEGTNKKDVINIGLGVSYHY